MLISKYNPVWKQQFEDIKERLSSQLHVFTINIEHVGSTAVPKLDAKPIIDIDVIYFNELEFENIKRGLELLGYYHNGNQGIEGRAVFKRKGIDHDGILDKITHHLYLCKCDCYELKRHLLFRNYLRKSDVARDFYQDLKYELAAEAKQDKKEYADIKQLKANAFINYLIELEKLETEI